MGATGSEGPHVKGNYFENNEQALTAFGRIANAVIEDNVFAAGPIGWPCQIEWYSDANSIIRRNTLLCSASCAYKMVCGQIYLGHKPADPAGKGTIVVDNIATAISVNDGSAAARIDHNLVRSGAAPATFPVRLPLSEAQARAHGADFNWLRLRWA